MKRLIVVTMMLLTALTAGAKTKGDWKGKVVDANGEPVAYANVAVLSKVDSSVVCGAVTQDDGTFNIVTTETDGIMMVAMLGYGTQYLTPVDGMLITLIEDTQMLEGAAVTAVMPVTKLTAEGLQTNVRGSVLENVGTANDVLSRTPGLITSQNGLEVIGKGTPLVYINGRKVTDAGELPNFLTMDEEYMKKNKIQVLGTEEVLGRTCTIYTYKYKSMLRTITRKDWVWKGIVLKMETKGALGANNLMVVTEFQENPKIPASTFDLPTVIK